MTFTLPFDLEYFFVTVFAGSLKIFWAIMFMVIAYLGVRFRMPTVIIGAMFALLTVFFFSYLKGFAIVVFIFAAVIIGRAIYSLFSR